MVFARPLESVITGPVYSLFQGYHKPKRSTQYWSGAAVMPVYLRDPNSVVQNFRPFSLIGIRCKAMEKSLWAHILQSPAEYTTLCPANYGAMKNRS